MDLRPSAAAETFREELRDFLARELPASWAGVGALSLEDRETFLHAWRQKLVDASLLAPHWTPDHGGRGLSVVEQSILIEEFVRAGVPHLPHDNDGFGLNLLGPTLLHWGTDDQKAEFLPRTLTGDIRWAQGYSEPEAGSDLFSLKTRAVRTNEGWRVTGQKVWQTAGVTANWLFLLVRTDPDLPRGRGISLILLPTDQPGVEVRGIANMAGQVEFSEVHLDGAVASNEHVVGGLNNGARVALTLLGFERGAGGLAAALRNRLELDRLAALARSTGQADDPTIRERLGRAAGAVRNQRAIALRSLAAASQGAETGALSSVTKLMASTYRQLATEIAVDLLGPHMNDLSGPAPHELLQPQPRGFDPTSARAWWSDFMNARAISIYGGSSEVQRNTIGEQMLGLPREPRPAA